MKTRYIKIHNKFYIQIFKNNTWTFFHYNKYNEKMLYFNSIFNKLECSWEQIKKENINLFLKYDKSVVVHTNDNEAYILFNNSEIYCAAMCASLKLILEEKIINVDNDFNTFNA
jgi:hypothetical protein